MRGGVVLEIGEFFRKQAMVSNFEKFRIFLGFLNEMPRITGSVGSRIQSFEHWLFSRRIGDVLKRRRRLNLKPNRNIKQCMQTKTFT